MNIYSEQLIDPERAARGMRLSADFRYQAEGEALSDMGLEPHFGRLTWEQVYEGWQSDELNEELHRQRYESERRERSGAETN